VQVTPPGSACSIAFGSGMGNGNPGSVKGNQFVVADIQDAAAPWSGSVSRTAVSCMSRTAQ
jgi:hypothetical protein